MAASPTAVMPTHAQALQRVPLPAEYNFLPVGLKKRLATQQQETLAISRLVKVLYQLSDFYGLQEPLGHWAFRNLQANYNAGRYTPPDKPAETVEESNKELALSDWGRGKLAEKAIKAQLRSEGRLLEHSHEEDLVRVVRNAMSSATQLEEEVYVHCGLVPCPSFEDEYAREQWARPGVRWGSFIPDLIEIKPEAEGGFTFKVIEIKYTKNKDPMTWFNHRVQAIFCRLHTLGTPRPVRPTLC